VKALRTLRGLIGSCLGQKLPGSIYVDQQFAVLSKGVRWVRSFLSELVTDRLSAGDSGLVR